MPDKTIGDVLIESCVHVRRLGNSEESADLCKLTEHPSGRMNICELISGNECENYESEEDNG